MTACRTHPDCPSFTACCCPFLSSDDPGSWDPVAVEPSLQAKETLEAETAPVSKAATRAARLPTTCSILVTLVVKAATVSGHALQEQ